MNTPQDTSERLPASGLLGRVRCRLRAWWQARYGIPAIVTMEGRGAYRHRLFLIGNACFLTTNTKGQLWPVNADGTGVDGVGNPFTWQAEKQRPNDES